MLHSHPLLLGLLSLLWLIVRSGGKPARIAYPCQQAALGGASLGYAAGLAPWLYSVSRSRWRPRLRLAAASGLLVALAIGGASDAEVDHGSALGAVVGAGEYQADLFVVTNAGPPAGMRHPGVDRLVAGMGAAGTRFYRSAVVGAESGPDGIVGADDVVLVKVNSQWPERGGTNTDVLKGLITRVLEHPDGFHGEVVVVDNGQGRGSFAWPGSNAEAHEQSVQQVVASFASRGEPVSAYLWDGIRNQEVAEYADGDLRDGYVVGGWNDTCAIRVSYPKFRTAGGSYVSLKRGIWNPSTARYDDTRLRFLNLPVLKCHGTYGVTGAIKHHVGTMTTSLGTNTHGAVGSGGIGAFLAQVRMPDLNLLDGIYVLADPSRGPECSYSDATRTDVLAASRDPVALDVWAVANILVPAMVANGHTEFPMQNPFDANSTFRRYLDVTAEKLVAAGISVTNDLGHVRVHVSGVTPGGDTTVSSTRAYPNPFATATHVRFVAARTGIARLDVYDPGGRLCRSIIASVERGATCEIRWDGCDQDGRPSSAGAYYYRVTGAGAPIAGRVTLAR